MGKLIELKNVSKEIGGKEILHSISATVEENRIYALIGPNGAGKTTFIRVLLGLYQPTAGELSLNIGSKQEIGFMLHANGLYPMLTCFENLKLYAEVYHIQEEQRIDEVLQLVGLTDKKDSAVNTLSKGMRQKLAMARAILHQPRILIMDEPTVGLEIETKIWFRDFLKEYAKQEGHAVLLSSHELTELEKICTDIIILREGKLIQQERVENIQGSLEEYYLDSAKNLVEQNS